MSHQFEVRDANSLYLVLYTLRFEGEANLLPRAARKAAELNVRGYMTHTQSGHAVSGELEGRRENLDSMLLWLQQETPKDKGAAHFSPYRAQSTPKYDDFFCC
ncbi:hypothetical protein KR222_003819 [Zaprionus bogoriensis]|nr:hypothetical protein KR222_003819 [Zaprionus bogoriensis]